MPTCIPSSDTVIRTAKGVSIGDTRTNKLTAKHCETAGTGKHADGGGLYLLVKESGKYWRFDYRTADKRKTASYGTYPTVSLKEARSKHALFKAQLAQGIDPMAAKKQAKEEARIESISAFATVAGQWFAAMQRGWGDKHRTKISRQLNKTHPARVGRSRRSQHHPRADNGTGAGYRPSRP